MANIWRKHPFRLLLYLEWILLGIALVSVFGGLVPALSRHWISPPAWSSPLGIVCIATLSFIGLRLPQNSRVVQQIYILSGFLLSWITVLSIRGGERISAVLFLVVVIRGCLLFSWKGRICTAVLAYTSFLAIQIMSLMRINPWGVALGRPLPRALRRLPPDELRRVLFSLAFNSALLFAFVLMFVLLLVGAVLAEYESRTKLIQANRRLRQYAMQIENQATLQERNRIAREIHDSVGHYLTAQSIQLENTAVFLAEDSIKAANHLAKARQLGKEALANIRASVATLRRNSTSEKSFNQENNTTGFGLQGIEERTKALRGIFTINSNSSLGCQLIIEIPLSQPIS